MVAKAAKVEEAEASHSITNGAATMNPLVFDELAEIIRCAFNGASLVVNSCIFSVFTRGPPCAYSRGVSEPT